MKAEINFNAERAAEHLLEDVLHRRRFSVDLRDALADRLEEIVKRTFKDAGITVRNRYETRLTSTMPDDR